MKKSLFVIFSLLISNNTFAVIPVTDAVNAKVQALKYTEMLANTKEMIVQGKTMVDQAKTMKDQYDSMVDKVEDAKNYYERAKRIKDSAENYMQQLESMEVLKVNGFKFDFKSPSLLQHQTKSLYTDVSEDPALAYFGEKYRENQRNEIAKASVANAQAVIYQQEDRAKELETLTSKYERADTVAKKETVQNAILLNVLRQLQTMTQLQAEMNAVIIGKEAKAKQKETYKKWDNKDWGNHFSSGGGKASWKPEGDTKKALDDLGI